MAQARATGCQLSVSPFAAKEALQSAEAARLVEALSRISVSSMRVGACITSAINIILMSLEILAARNERHDQWYGNHSWGMRDSLKTLVTLEWRRNRNQASISVSWGILSLQKKSNSTSYEYSPSRGEVPMNGFSKWRQKTANPAVLKFTMTLCKTKPVNIVAFVA